MFIFADHKCSHCEYKRWLSNIGITKTDMASLISSVDPNMHGASDVNCIADLGNLSIQKVGCRSDTGVSKIVVLNASCPSWQVAQGTVNFLFSVGKNRF